MDRWLLEQRAKKPAEIVLYGQSVGTGPTVDLAAREAGVGGVVLLSPLMSGKTRPCFESA